MLVSHVRPLWKLLIVLANEQYCQFSQNVPPSGYIWIVYLSTTAAPSTLSCGSDTASIESSNVHVRRKLLKKTLRQQRLSHQKHAYLKDAKRINCRSVPYRQRPSGAFGTLTALVMFHCPSKGHTANCLCNGIKKKKGFARVTKQAAATLGSTRL